MGLEITSNLPQELLELAMELLAKDSLGLSKLAEWHKKELPRQMDKLDTK